MSGILDWFGNQVTAELEARRKAIYAPPVPATVGADNGVPLVDGRPQPRTDAEAGSRDDGGLLDSPLVIGGLVVAAALIVYLAVR